MTNLDDDLRAMSMDSVGEPSEIWNHFVLREGWLVAGGRTVRIGDS
jgi:hypothetical protein